MRGVRIEKPHWKRNLTFILALFVLFSTVYVPTSLAESGNEPSDQEGHAAYAANEPSEQQADEVYAANEPSEQQADEVYAATQEQEDGRVELQAVSAEQLVIDKIAALQVTTLADREAVVLTRQNYNKLNANQKKLVTNLNLLEEAEARILNLWIDSAKIASPVDEGLVGVLIDQYEHLKENQKSLITHFGKLAEMEEKLAELRVVHEQDYSKAKVVQKLLDHMQVLKHADKSAAVKARASYDGLTSDQKAIVTNYHLLKEAENKIAVWEGKPLPHQAPGNIAYAGTRSSDYGVSGEWLGTADWQHITDQMKGYFPDAQPTYVWIIGRLDGGAGVGGARMEFERPEDGIDYAAKNISFGPPTKTGHLSHEDYLNYFDQQGIKVILQVESGFADMKDLMDLIFKKYGHHKSVIGFGVDVEWYYGVSEDAGLPVTDATARDWDQHLKTINPAYRLMLKHYSAQWLPPTYRSDIWFCNDSQSLGSIDGEVTGMYDDTMGFIPEFKAFADYFYPNDVLYQIGYAPDAMWYYPLQKPVIKNLGERLSEATRQKLGITWVDFTIKDPLTFPALFKTDREHITAVKRLLGYLRNSGNNMVGKRFGAQQATLTDALFVAQVRDVVNALSESQKALLEENDTANLILLEPLAVDIRIAEQDISALKLKDEAKLTAIRAAYDALTEEQQAKVASLAQLEALEKQMKVLKTSTSGGNQGGGGNGGGSYQPGVKEPEKKPENDGEKQEDDTTIIIPAADIHKGDSLKVTVQQVELRLDKAALKAIGANADLKASVVQGKLDGLSASDQATIGTRPIYHIKLQSGERTVSSLGGGTMSVSIPYKLKAGEDPNAIVVYQLHADHKLEVIQDSIYDEAAGKVIFNSGQTGQFAVGYSKPVYADVTGWYGDAVTYLAARGIVQGVDGQHFAPQANIKRAEFVQMIANIAGAEQPVQEKSAFSDVNEGDWYYAAVTWASSNGIVLGADGKFNPHALITRQDMAVILARYIDKAGKSTLTAIHEPIVFNDQERIAEYAQSAVAAMQTAGILTGRGNQQFAPQATATRAEAAQMISKFLQRTIK
ncbi:S-layer homology domain-containing protein [Paenibacillaceae bacterium]|nr:S-layer homology domain-containing protein [Paenibacillaceae bacterium]